jgi:hypothetical protein
MNLIAQTATASPSPEGSAAVGLAIIAFGIATYFLPIFVAGLRGKAEGQIGIFLITLFGGWTGVVWLVCLIWAFTGRTQKDIWREKQRHEQLIAALAAVSGSKPPTAKPPIQDGLPYHIGPTGSVTAS